MKQLPYIPCLRCGVCCQRYQVQLDLIEARRICAGLGLEWDVFITNYLKPLWAGADRFFLSRRDGACIFLKPANELYKTSCLVHAFKPAACRDWTPSLYRRECQEGLLRDWGLRLSPEGELEGSEEQLRRFQSFLDSLMAAGGKEDDSIQSSECQPSLTG